MSNPTQQPSRRALLLVDIAIRTLLKRRGFSPWWHDLDDDTRRDIERAMAEAFERENRP